MKNLLKYIFLGLAVSFLAGCGDSGSKKWRLDNKELTADEVANLKIAIAFRDEIIQKNEWAKLNGDFWSDILVFFPEEAKRCRELKGFEKFDGSNWANLLAEEPRFEKDCEKNRGWEAIPPKDWIKLLKKQPNYLSKAKQLNAFERFTAENWRDVISSKDVLLLKECDASNGWKTLKANDWVVLLKNKAIDENLAEKHNAFATLSLSDWTALILSDKKYIDLAKKHNVYSKLDNATWAKLISKNPTFSEIAEKEGVFEKFTPNEWNMLFISNPEFAAVAKKSKALEKYSKADLIKLYVLQPKLRNEIFALNKINLDFAKQIEILHRKATSGQTLNAEQFTVLSSIFPEFLDSISENSFSGYGLEDWKIALGKSPSFFKKISEKYAYLVPWKNLSFADWCEILDTNPDLTGTFKNNVKISELSVTDITKALTNARFKGYYTLDTLDLWSQFTPDQYFGLLSNQGGMAAMIGLMENLGGVSINSVEDMQTAMYNFKQKEKRAANMALLNGDMSGYEELFPKPKREPRNYDDKFIISKAKQNGVFAKLTEEQWGILFQRLSDKKDEKQNLLIKEYFSLEKQFPSITQKLVGSNNFTIISENKLWNNLNKNQWVNFIANTIKKYKSEQTEEISNQIQQTLSIFDSSNIIEKFDQKYTIYFLKDCATIFDGMNATGLIEDFKKLSLWNKIPKETWMLYFCSESPNQFYIEKSGAKNWNKEDNNIILKMYFDREKSGSRPICPPKPFTKIININLLDLTEARNIISEWPWLFDSYEKNSQFSLNDLYYFYVNEITTVNLYTKAEKVNTLLKNISKDDRNLLSAIFFDLKREVKIGHKSDGLSQKIPLSQIRLFCTKCQKPYEELCKEHEFMQKCAHTWNFSIGNPPKRTNNTYRRDVPTEKKSSDIQPKTIKASSGDLEKDVNKSIRDLMREANSTIF